jgi:hypothetical protein
VKIITQQHSWSLSGLGFILPVDDARSEKEGLGFIVIH